MPSESTVLVVDDSAAIRLLCRVNLELDGHRVLEAERLSEARARLEEADVQAVVLDVRVGPEDGIGFLAELRRHHPGLPVMLLTGSSELDRVRRFEPDAVMGKPFEVDELRKTVSGLVHSANAV